MSESTAGGWEDGSPPSGCPGVRDAAAEAGVLSRPTQILVANDNACRLLGYSSHDLIGQRLTQFFLKPDCDVVEALSEEHVEADGHAAVVFGTVVSVGVGTGRPAGRAAGALLGRRRCPRTEAAAAGLAPANLWAPHPTGPPKRNVLSPCGALAAGGAGGGLLELCSPGRRHECSSDLDGSSCVFEGGP